MSKPEGLPDSPADFKSGTPPVSGRARIGRCNSRPKNPCPIHLPYGYDIRTVQELLGYKDVKTTVVYTHVLKSGPAGVKSPLDRAPSI
ncbi:MAG TPA: hypothetical protein ENF27_01830 [Chloroflexi bacterium]|nr:hypothetical protein [Chloroflexota bacterium]